MPAAESSPTSTLIGLDNLRQRLARHYGPGCEIEIARDPGWVRMRLRLKRGLPTAPKPRTSHEPFPSK
jgi:LytS/YehU family sensor histidine kinase